MMVRQRFGWHTAVIIAAFAALIGPEAARADTATGSMTVSTTISSVCSVSIVSNVSFGTIASQSVSTTDTTGSFSVTCSTGTAYSIALDLGGNANVSTRRMKSGTSNYLTYELYSDNARTAIWRTAISGYTGTNSAQTQTVYARLPSQLAPAPGVYTDTVTITVTY